MADLIRGNVRFRSPIERYQGFGMQICLSAGWLAKPAWRILAKQLAPRKRGIKYILVWYKFSRIL
jgi:hypothetical protein